MKRKNAVLPPSFLLVYLVLSVVVHFCFPIKIINSSFRILGILFIIFGLVINFWADEIFKKEKTTVKPNEISTKLITTGPFCFSRHPMYLGFVMLLLGISMVLGSVSSFIGPVMMFVTLERKFISNEERKMKKCFGKEYLKYKNKVRRWL